MPEQLCVNFGKSFLLQGVTNQSKTTDFALALSRVVEFISPAKIPVVILPPYVEFFKNFHPTEEHQQDIYSLKSLLKLAKYIGADMTWVAKM